MLSQHFNEDVILNRRILQRNEFLVEDITKRTNIGYGRNIVLLHKFQHKSHGVLDVVCVDENIVAKRTRGTLQL